MKMHISILITEQKAGSPETKKKQIAIAIYTFGIPNVSTQDKLKWLRFEGSYVVQFVAKDLSYVCCCYHLLYS